VWVVILWVCVVVIFEVSRVVVDVGGRFVGAC